MKSMFEPSYKLYINNKYFDSVYPVDYYNDKKVFFDSGRKQFFIVYQILRNLEFTLTIEEKTSGARFNIPNEIEFENWVTKCYLIYKDLLEAF